MNALTAFITASSAGLGAYFGARVHQHPPKTPRVDAGTPDDTPDEDLSAVAVDWAEARGRPDIAVLMANKLTTVRRVHRRRQIGRLR